MSEKTVGSVDLSGLNDAQRTIAETLDAPLFVEAGAGSGKTFTLTRRIAWALSPGSGEGGKPYLDSLDQVLVITFTEAAAREIKERVRGALRRAQMSEAALAVDDAWISTIHGMCRRILSRHALDLGLDPSFEVVADSRQAALFDRAMDDVMRAARRDEAFAPVFAEFDLGTYAPQSGYTGAMGIVERLVGEARSLSGGVDALSPACVPRDSVASALRDLEMRLEELGAQRLTASAAEKVAPALETVRALAARPARELTPEVVDVALAGLSLPQARGAIKEAVLAVRSALALARAEASFVRVAPLSGFLLELARRVSARYDEIKRAESCLDNDDLVRLALLAVRDNDEVRRDYAGRFRLVMVDEFQDTDEMQLELIGLLAGEGARHLCTVGDAQQSIYRFRGADVSVFRGRGTQVARENVVRLDTNYRSHPDVLALVERVCTGGGASGAVMPDFMHLEPNPDYEDDYQARELPRIDIEVCAGKGRAGRPSRHQTATMAAQIADALAAYRDAGERPGDMALLLGVTTHVDLYIDAIRARGMECVVTGGSTFTSTDEVKVMRALLHVLANPADTQSGLFPLLASEMFGLDANDFCDLGTRTQEKLDAPTKRSIDRGLADMEFYRSRTPSARLERAHEVISRAIDEVGWRPVADVCADVVRDSGWLARLERGGAEGLARAANVLAAVRYVRDLTSDLGLGPARAATEFDLWLAAAKVPPASLAGAEGGSGGGTVRVMTVHASKGLEFGVCAVAECWGNPRSEAQLAVGAESGGKRFVLRPKEAPKLDDVDPEELVPSADKSAQMPLSARYLALRGANDEAEAHEKARLLYVALTRACRALIVGVAGASGKAGVSSALAASALDALSDGAWVEGAGVRSVDYGGSGPARLRCVIVEDQGRGADKRVVADSAGTLVGFDGELPADPAEVVRCGALGEAAPSGEPGPFDLYDIEAAATLERPLTWRAREGTFSYSSVHAATRAEGPSRPPAPTREQREAEATGAPDTEDADRATNLGSALHELAQAMVECGGAVDEARVLAQVRRWNLSSRAELRLRAALDRWERSSLRAEALAWPEVRPEVPFFQRVDSPHGEYLEGAMDLLCSDGAGRRALVVDYKTGDAGLARDEVCERHAMQAQFYAGVLLREGFEQVECAFVCVERDDPNAPGEPLVVRYAFGA